MSYALLANEKCLSRRVVTRINQESITAPQPSANPCYARPKSTTLVADDVDRHASCEPLALERGSDAGALLLSRSGTDLVKVRVRRVHRRAPLIEALLDRCDELSGVLVIIARTYGWQWATRRAWADACGRRDRCELLPPVRQLRRRAGR